MANRAKKLKQAAIQERWRRTLARRLRVREEVVDQLRQAESQGNLEQVARSRGLTADRYRSEAALVREWVQPSQRPIQRRSPRKGSVLDMRVRQYPDGKAWQRKIGDTLTRGS